MVAGRFRPLATAELIRHPFANFGMTKKEWRKRASALEFLVLRGPRPNGGLDGLGRRLDESLAERHARPNAPHAYLDKQAALAAEALAKLRSACAPLLDVNGEAPLSVWVEAHVTSARAIAEREDGTGGDIFLREADGDALSTLLDEWRRTENHGFKLAVSDYAPWVGTLFDRTAVRLRYRQHPRLFIWGSPESRLQAVDRVIIGGCNEGGWPRMPSPDPWLNRDMLAALGLPDPESQIGLNAQDFLHLVCLPEVYLTRAIKQDGAEAVAARYLAKLQARLAAVHPNAFATLHDKGRFWVNTVDRLYQAAMPDKTPAAEITVNPEHLPKTWSASTVRNLMQCPYRTYVSKVLKLEKLPAFEEAPDAAERGNVLHGCLHAFFEKQDGLPPPFGQVVTEANKAEAEAHLRHIGEVAFSRVASQTVRAVWWPRFCRMAGEFVHVLSEQYASARVPDAFEAAAQHPLQDITLFARADRIDKTSDGYVVMDYKTGGIPSKTAVRSGKEPQMTLELLLMQQQHKVAAGAEYWNVANSQAGFGLNTSASITADEVPQLVAEAQDGLERLYTHFMTDKKPMQAIPGGASPLKSEGLCTYCDYSGVCRFKEWQGHEFV
jgi:ATP-dependent helicase/nuclease subunit B